MAAIVVLPCEPYCTYITTECKQGKVCTFFAGKLPSMKDGWLGLGMYSVGLTAVSKNVVFHMLNLKHFKKSFR